MIKELQSDLKRSLNIDAESIELLLVGGSFLDEIEGLLDDKSVLLLRVVLFDPFGDEVGDDRNQVGLFLDSFADLLSE